MAGVKLPRFEVLADGGGSKMDMAGLGKGGAQLQACRKKYMEAIELLIELASLQTAFLTLDNAIKTTNRRVNALENVVTPRLENTITYIKVRRRRRRGPAGRAAPRAGLPNARQPQKPPPKTRQGELDELEREEFFRLKKVQAKKKRDTAAADVLRHAAEAAAGGISVVASLDGAPSSWTPSPAAAAAACTCAAKGP